jgi:hypothetical protein
VSTRGCAPEGLAIGSKRAGSERLELCEQWRDVSDIYGADSNPALGCLLALVREAWGDEKWIDVSIDPTGAAVKLSDERGEFLREFIEDTLAEALVTALERAPQ